MSFPLILAAAAAAAVPQATAATLDQLRANPPRYSGRLVRVSGQLDQCWNMSCSLCPLEASPARPQWERCLAIGFDRFTGGPNNRGADMDSAFRYTDVTVVARFDPTCLKGLCTDRASVLEDARVEQVSRRRRSRDGLMRRKEPLTQPPANAAAAVASLLPRGVGEERYPAVRVFATPSDPRLQRSAIVCRASRLDTGADIWPDSWHGAIARSTEEPYRCWTARRVGAGWALEP